ncbi:MAG: tannase, partial [Lachnospiraceae bacterium]|nr:tannase [Lachnospiraceae bacterium]
MIGSGLVCHLEKPASEKNAKAEVVTNLSTIDMSAWSYNSSGDVYYQTGISYCESPADSSYETMGIYIPAAYMNATQNSDGSTYTCTINESGTVGNYTASTAPMVIPVNTAGYSAMSPPTGYTSSAAEFAAEGIIYVYAGCRGRDSGAPTGVTDLKAAIRYVRYNADVIPGDT